ncbi:MAG: hypothetical protein KAS85_03915 [Rhodobacteraceae bacterium]|nr:hypothetical protein [Paracoccaceae bacterium]
MHKKFIALALAAIVLSGCDTMLQTVGLGAAAGAVGASALGGNSTAGLLVGGGIAYCSESPNC